MAIMIFIQISFLGCLVFSFCYIFPRNIIFTNCLIDLDHRNLMFVRSSQITLTLVRSAYHNFLYYLVFVFLRAKNSSSRNACADQLKQVTLYQLVKKPPSKSPSKTKSSSNNTPQKTPSKTPTKKTPKKSPYRLPPVVARFVSQLMVNVVTIAANIDSG